MCLPVPPCFVVTVSWERIYRYRYRGAFYRITCPKSQPEAYPTQNTLEKDLISFPGEDLSGIPSLPDNVRKSGHKHRD